MDFKEYLLEKKDLLLGMDDARNEEGSDSSSEFVEMLHLDSSDDEE